MGAEPAAQVRYGIGRSGRTHRGGEPDWRLAWLIVNLVPPGPKASDADIELELDRLLNPDLGSAEPGCSRRTPPGHP
jgi:hypothetical protein